MKIADFIANFGRAKHITPIPSPEELVAFAKRASDFYSGKTVDCVVCGLRFVTPDDYDPLINVDEIDTDVVRVRSYHVCDTCRGARLGYATCDTCGLQHTRTYGIKDENGINTEVGLCPVCAKDGIEKEEVYKCGRCGRLSRTETHSCMDVDEGVAIGLCGLCMIDYDVCPNCNAFNATRYKYRTPDQDGRVISVDACSHCLDYVDLGRCELCNGLFTENLLTESNGRTMCKRCEAALKPICTYCGGANETANDYCMTCRTGYIRDWNYTPEKTIFHGDGPYYGIELEITGFPALRRREDYPTGDKLKCALELHAISPNESDLYLMKDSTINGGFEIAFQPRSVEDWMTNGRRILEHVRAVVRKYGAVSYKGGSCGIHIHRSREDIDTAAREAALFYALQSIEPYAYILAQRTGITNKIDVESGALAKCEYGSFSRQKDHFPDHQCADISAKEIIAAQRNWAPRIANEHHAAITYGNNGITIELRIFRGTLAIDTILAYLSFYSILAEWSKSTSLTRLMKLSNAKAWKEFAGFVRLEESEQATRLISYIKTKGLVI